MTRALVILTLLAATGCANVTTMKIHRTVSGDISIDSGKDVKFSSLSYRNPSGEALDVKGYSSNANADVIDAQTVREKNMLDALGKAIDIGKSLAVKGATGL